MSDIRARLVDALQENDLGRMAVDIADVLLSLPGIAIVELPEPSYVDEPEGDGVKGYGFNGVPADADICAEHGVYAYDGLVYDQYDGISPAKSRTIASWWLAAANAAEQVAQ